MTTLLSRLYADKRAANSVRERLFRAGFPRHTMRVITDDGADSKAISKRIQDARVPKRAASVYAEGVAEGHALLIVEAEYKPLGARKIGRATLEETDAMPVNLKSEEFEVETVPDHAPRVLRDHPRFLTAAPDPEHIGGPLSDQLGFSLLSSTKRRNSVMEGGWLIFPFPALAQRRKTNSVIRGGSFASRVFWPMKLVTRKPRRKSVISGGGHPFSRLFGWRTIS